MYEYSSYALVHPFRKYLRETDFFDELSYLEYINITRNELNCPFDIFKEYQHRAAAFILTI